MSTKNLPDSETLAEVEEYELSDLIKNRIAHVGYSGSYATIPCLIVE